jgi:hypothetical protein
MGTLAPGVAVDFIGTPGEVKNAAGRVTVAAPGASGLFDAASATALLVADLAAESVGAEVVAALGVEDGGVVDVTVAVIEYAGAAHKDSARTSKLRFMGTPFIVAAATIRGMRNRVRPSRR